MVVSDAAGAPGKFTDGACGAVAVTDILGAGQRVIAGMRSTTGHGRPDAGESFQYGATGFLAAARTVECAYPRDEWEGGAAQSYTVATRRLAGAAEALAVLDRDVHTVIDREATQIIRRRETLDDHAHQLSSLRRVTGSLAAIPGVGPAMKSSIELAAVTAAVGVCSTELGDLAAETADNASRLRRIAGEYEALVGEAGPIDSPDSEAASIDTESTDLPAAPDDLPEPGSGTSAPLLPSPTCPAPGPVTTSEQSPMQGDMLSGLTSAFGAVGGMIGTAVAPLAAALGAVVTAVGQLPSPASQAAAPQAPPVDVRAEEKESPDDTGDPAAEAETEPADSEDAVVPETPPEQVPSPPPSPPAPAATRPPQ
ncbi:EspA/EspE family type VII secretion system effector [Mycobacterium sp. PSTR-4-N]|uniref:EspA/EspE family type VII secretion system effector n=1 Tax=Mycobacterium sp. PSTR-4-N TaxID=2917745 RepID=UPI001F154940|nr:EspA/EspE family type VII secretion system effector [Mycobacterium sp. PSTR-4-N]MCG7594156.1 hypothetical protein [Mycobacterium sp. PSTR-4-N]